MASGRFSNLEFDDNHELDAGLDCSRIAPNACRDADYYLDDARGLELAAEPEAALRSYSAALGEDPQRLDAWVGQLWILYELGEYPEVDLWARKALEHFPQNPALVAMRSLAALGEGRKREARALNDSALAKQGESDSVWLARADILMHNRGTPAEDCLAHAERASERPEMALLRTARISMRHRRHRVALAALHKLTERCPTSAAAWHLLGLTQWRLGDLGRARESLEQARELAPHNPLIGSDHARLLRHARGGPLQFMKRLFSR